MADLQIGQFRDFFRELHEKPPFPWQEALAEQVCTGDWPEVIHLPTASGKTACLDIALFALAVRGDAAARRIFFVVDRRVVVDEAYLRMDAVRCKLGEAKSGILRDVAERLRSLARGGEAQTEDDDAAPLLVSEMRGGAFRDESWVKNPLQPTVVASTVDQVGSRLLFRGYGVSENSWSLHAGLIANDALIFLDEAHCSRAFAQTLERVVGYRGGNWASDPIPTPFHFVKMTATPSGDVEPKKVFKLTSKDRETAALKMRLQAAKPTRLIEIKARKDDNAKIVDALIEQATGLAKAAEAKRVVIFANRVKMAKDTFRKLEQRVEGTGAQVELLIGSMRPVDRDDLYDHKLKRLKSDVKRNEDAPLTFVVSTQCLEVGADLDFDVLVSECASIDALLQRFGRLDRLGEFDHAQGAIVIGSWQVDPKQPDPVYREALSKTWRWLNSIASEIHEVNMGIESRPGEKPTVSEQLESAGPEDLRLIGEDAPILLPAHVDMLVQTSPVPEPDPSVELFLHGPKRGIPDVQVVWRNDLEYASEDEEIEIVKLCPPSTREAMPVRISIFKKWFGGDKDIAGQESDLEVGAEEEETYGSGRSHVLLWDGEKSRRILEPKEVKPGQTLVLRASLECWDELGYIPKWATIDIGDRAAFESRKAVSLRLHPDVIREWRATPALAPFLGYLEKGNVKQFEVEDQLRVYCDELKGQSSEGDRSWPYAFLSKLDELRRRQLDFYPQKFCALRARHAKRKPKGEQIFLEDHLQHVEDAVRTTTSDLRSEIQEAFVKTAALHDYGKADVRYQAWLRNGDFVAARYAPKQIAKSGIDVLRKQKTVGLPEGFRHELISLMFAEKLLETDSETRDLILHLVAAHHGRCRPFAPVVLDKGAECVPYGGASLCKQERIDRAPHRLDSGVADRFWRLTAKYGWWGLAYLEALLRLADWQASDNEVAEVPND